ncbi:flagellar hook-length control protein FliK [Pseudomaricurvus sp.]|uniref:flagellar hook-length control protein FliK n=1 Tax=Pseudomaricurvus sp. TaxID=2004510 RepID=UPI003F6CA2A6
MVIDLPSSSQTTLRGNQSPVTQLMNQRQETLQAALKALNVKAGETITALVKSIHPVDDPLRARLIQQATPPSESANASANRNATAQDKLLSSSNLKLVELEVKGKSVLIYTDKAIRPNQTLSLQLQNGQLVQVPNNQATPSYTTMISQSASQSALQAQPGNHLVDSKLNALTSQQLTTLQQALRTQLPQFAQMKEGQASAISESLIIAQLITKIVQQPGHTSLQQLPRSLQESLQQLASHLRSPQQLSQPDSLKQAIKGSGLQLEHQLGRQGSNVNTNSANHAPLSQTDLKAALLHTLNQLSKFTQQPATPQGMATQVAAQSSTSQAQASTPPSIPGYSLPTATPANPALSAQSLSAQSLSAQTLHAKTIGAQGLISLLQQLLPTQSKRSSHQTSVAPQQLMQALQGQVHQALGKILYLQLQSLQRSHPNSEGVKNQSVQLEIPLNLGYNAQSLSMEIEDDWVTDYSDDKASSQEKARQWQVKLTFELPDAGYFHAHLTILNQQVNASLWAENPDTFHTARETLNDLRQQLEKDGCTVKNLECFPGKPATDNNMRLNYALVDIKT